MILQQLALIILLAAAAWLAFVAVLCLVSPERARAGLAAMGGTVTIQFAEHILRGLAGAAMILRAEASRAPQAFEIVGWFIMATSVLILLLPRKWHHAYAQWWAARIPTWAFRIASLPTIIGAAILAHVAI